MQNLLIFVLKLKALKLFIIDDKYIVESHLNIL